MTIDLSKSSIPLFQSEDRLELLNDIDKFRQHGLANLPQIVVCGDTSSGKSSVLEALSGIPFPIDSTICTRFATEIALRYSSDETVTGEAFISAGPRASENHQLRVELFKVTITSFESVPDILRQAQEAMGLAEGAGVSRDVLHLRLQGRALPNLTLVDLPGLIHAATDSDDIAKVQGLVEHYFNQKESLIMTIVSAENPIENQGILTFSQRFDPKGERSIGVITKPDILQRPDKRRLTPTVLELGRNQHSAFKFKREWQIMRCLTDDERQRGADRDKIEADVFSHDPWDSFSQKRLGTKSLRSVLCDYLQEHILTSLPELVSSLEGRVASLKTSLQELGPLRVTQEERMQYLIRISRHCGQLVRDALNGDYSDAFFHKSEPGRRLRATTMALADDFEAAIRTRGHDFEVMHSPFSSSSPADPRLPSRISMEDALVKVGTLIDDYRGPELPLVFNPRLIGELFKQQSQKWPQLALEYTSAIRRVVEAFLRKVVEWICPSSGRTCELILQHLFQDTINDLHEKVNAKVAELFAPHTGFFLFSTRNRLQEALNTIQADDEPWAANDDDSTSPSEAVDSPDSGNTTRLKALQLSRAYYNVTLDTFVDNVVVLGVESCLLSKLEEIFSPEKVAQMSPDQLQLLGGETPEVVAERTDLLTRLRKIEAALKNCRRHASREFGLDTGTPQPLIATDDKSKNPASSTGRVAQAEKSRKPVIKLPPDAVVNGTSTNFKGGDDNKSGGLFGSVASTSGALGRTSANNSGSQGLFGSSSVLPAPPPSSAVLFPSFTTTAPAPASLVPPLFSSKVFGSGSSRNETSPRPPSSTAQAGTSAFSGFATPTKAPNGEDGKGSRSSTPFGQQGPSPSPISKWAQSESDRVENKFKPERSKVSLPRLPEGGQAPTVAAGWVQQLKKHLDHGPESVGRREFTSGPMVTCTYMCLGVYSREDHLASPSIAESLLQDDRTDLSFEELRLQDYEHIFSEETKKCVAMKFPTQSSWPYSTFLELVRLAVVAP